MQNNAYTPLNVELNYFKLLERFCAVMYDKTSSLDSVDEVQRELFCQKNRTMETIPPTQDALIQHTRCIWTASDNVNQDTPSPEGHNWTMDKNSNYGYLCGQRFP